MRLHTEHTLHLDTAERFDADVFTTGLLRARIQVIKVEYSVGSDRVHLYGFKYKADGSTGTVWLKCHTDDLSVLPSAVRVALGLDPEPEPQAYVEVGELTPDGTVGGDGAGESQSRRWKRQRPDGNWDLVTVYGYAVDGRERGWDAEGVKRHWHAEIMTEIMVCEDPEEPGATEVTCDYTYDKDVSQYAYVSEADALEVALNRVRRAEAPQ